MRYTWRDHAALERLPERSSMTISQIEDCLLQKRHVVSKRWKDTWEEHHLIWDEKKQCLIDVPIIRDNGTAVIPTILPVNDQGTWSEHVRCQAEIAWRGEAFYQTHNTTWPPSAFAEISFAKKIKKLEGFEWVRTETILFWALNGETVKPKDAGMMALLRDRIFCLTVKEIVKYADTPNLKIKIEKPGAVKVIPRSFFLNTP